MNPTIVVAIATFMVVLALSGCVRITIAPSPAAVAPPVVAPPLVAAAPPPVESAPPAVVFAPPAVVSAPPAVVPAAPPPAALESPPVAVPPVALAPPAVASTPSAVAPTPVQAPVPSAAPKTIARAPAPPKIEAVPPPKTPTTATLDWMSLETRLRATTAIGVFTKLSLKNQIGDLLAEFKTFHRGGAPALPALRQKYDLLLLKVLSLLQDDDASLAGAISGSRESIWRILVDPTKFAKLG